METTNQSLSLVTNTNPYDPTEKVTDLIRGIYENNIKENDLYIKIGQVIDCHPALVMTLQTKAQTLLNTNNPKAIDLDSIATQTIIDIANQSRDEQSLIQTGNNLMSKFLNKGTASTILNELREMHNMNSRVSIVMQNINSIITLIKCFTLDSRGFDNVPINKEIEKIVNDHLKNCDEKREKGQKEPKFVQSQELIKKCFYNFNSGIFGFGGPTVQRSNYDILKGDTKSQNQITTQDAVSTLSVIADNLNTTNSILHESVRRVKMSVEDQSENNSKIVESMETLESIIENRNFDKETAQFFIAQIKESFQENHEAADLLINNMSKTLNHSQEKRGSLNNILQDNCINFKKQKALPGGIFNGETQNKAQLTDEENTPPNFIATFR